MNSNIILLQMKRKMSGCLRSRMRFDVIKIEIYCANQSRYLTITEPYSSPVRQSSKFLKIIPPRLSKLIPVAYTDVILTFQALAKLIGLKVRSSEKDSYSVQKYLKTGTKDRRDTHTT